MREEDRGGERGTHAAVTWLQADLLLSLPDRDSDGPLVCDQGQMAGILFFISPMCDSVFKPQVVAALACYVSCIRKVIH